MKDFFAGFLILIFFILNCSLCVAQKHAPAYHRVDSFIQEYMQLSRLGPGYSRKMSQEIADQFKALFERDAFLYWDLYIFETDSLIPPLAVKDYIDLANKVHNQKQPLLDYPGVKIRVQKDGKNALVYLKKTNQIVNTDDKPLFTNLVNLRVNVNLNSERPLIQNIFEDNRVSLVRSISAGINYQAWSSAVSDLIYHTGILVGANEQYKEISITTETCVQVGGMVEIRINKEARDGLFFSVGMFYSELPLSSSMTDYSKSFADTLDKASANPLSCTTFESSPEVWEKIVVKKIDIPLLLKSYLNNWIYLKSGTCLSYITGTSDVNYFMSRTGGGLVTNLSSHESYFLDKDHELEQGRYGYYRNKMYSFSKEKFLNKMILSLHLAVGFEKQVSCFGFELEPNISFGMNPFSNRTPTGCYPLDDVRNFNSILRSTNSPAFEVAFGFRILVSYLFKN